MTKAIMWILEQINSLMFGAADDTKLTMEISGAIPQLYNFSKSAMETVMFPVAYTILALFFLLELHRASVKTEGMGGSAGMGSDMIFRSMFKMVLCKMAIDSSSLILEAIYSVTRHLIDGISKLNIGPGGTAGLDIASMEPVIEGMGFFEQLAALIFIVIGGLIALFAYLMANLFIIGRFIEIYLYFAVSPIPMATLPNEEFSQIGKNFLKSFAAVCVQGVMLFLVLTFYPIVIGGAFALGSNTGLLSIMVTICGYSLLLVASVAASGRYAKAITGAL